MEFATERGTNVGGAAARVSQRAIRVAVVDDHRLVLDGITACLRLEQKLRVVASEPTWVGLLAHPEFPVDVVVLDLHLRDQIAIGAKLKTLAAANCRTVVMSRHADVASIYSAIHSGALGFVPKTAAPAELVAAIEHAAANRRFENRSATDAYEVAHRSETPRLGNQERRALMLYALGSPMKEVAAAMQTTDDTVKSYIKRARRKYRKAGIDVGTRALLRHRAILEGWLSPE